MHIFEVDYCRLGNNNEKISEEGGIWRNSKEVSVVAKEKTGEEFVVDNEAG